MPLGGEVPLWGKTPLRRLGNLHLPKLPRLMLLLRAWLRWPLLEMRQTLHCLL